MLMSMTNNSYTEQDFPVLWCSM